jgi:hypothetical protein
VGFPSPFIVVSVLVINVSFTVKTNNSNTLLVSTFVGINRTSLFIGGVTVSVCKVVHVER